MEGSELKDPSGRIRAEGSERRELSTEQRDPSVWIQAEESSERIREEGYEQKGSKWKDLSGGI